MVERDLKETLRHYDLLAYVLSQQPAAGHLVHQVR